MKKSVLGAVVVGVLAGGLIAWCGVNQGAGVTGSVVVGVVLGVVLGVVTWCAIDRPPTIQYQHGDVVDGMFCNRCGRSLVLDLNHRIGETIYNEYSGGKLRVLPHTGGETAYDRDVKGVAWCPECKEEAKVYSLVGDLVGMGGCLQMWGHIQRCGVTAFFYDSLPVKVSRST